ncbi:MAG TPA: nuclear transport factor 2 family protein [Thermoanaerobaculia bacterium]|nr:nuclear transport factor 2 family protein [Thermoanaerobaculia bacterium]
MNRASVQSIYEAFGRGDIPSILEKLADDVQWEVDGSTTDVPWLQRRQGREGALAFFQSLAALDFQKFEVTAVIEAGDRVIGLCNVEATVRATGKKYVENDEVHLWWFDGQGRVAAFRHRIDTHLQWQAFHGNA